LPSRHSKLVYLLLALWLFASASGMHGHYCFDGQEPPVSVHFDVMDSHHAAHLDSHSAEHMDSHKDIDNPAPSISLLKLLNLDLPLLIAALLLVFWPRIIRQVYGVAQPPSCWITLTGLRPPLRAPPARSR
jgi:hypothetical protein